MSGSYLIGQSAHTACGRIRTSRVREEHNETVDSNAPAAGGREAVFEAVSRMREWGFLV